MVRSLFIYASWGTGCKQGPSQSLCLEPFGLMQGVSQLLGIPFGGIFTMHSLAFLFLLLSFRFYVRTCLVMLLPCFLTCLIHLHLLHPITSYGSTLLSFPLWLQILKCLNMKHLCGTTILLMFCCFPPDYLLHVHLYFDCHKSQHVGTHAEYITTPELYTESRQTFLQ